MAGRDRGGAAGGGARERFAQTPSGDKKKDDKMEKEKK